jgi:hypothetical protein
MAPPQLEQLSPGIRKHIARICEHIAQSQEDLARLQENIARTEETALASMQSMLDVVEAIERADVVLARRPLSVES